MTSRPRTTPAPLLALLVAFTLGPAPARAESGQFLMVSDIHFDPFYDGTLFDRLRAGRSRSGRGSCEGSRPAGLNPRGTDSNYALLRSSLDDARRRIPDPDFILIPGDLMAHRWQGKYDDLAARSHTGRPRGVSRLHLQGDPLPGRRVPPAISRRPRSCRPSGNDDSDCGDYMITPDGPFLAMFARLWGPLLGPDVDGAAFRETFSRGGYYTVRLPGPRGHRLVVLNTRLLLGQL